MMRMVQRRPRLISTQNRAICKSTTSVKKKQVDRPIVSEHPHADDPGGVQEHYQRQMGAAILDPAGGKQSAFVLPHPPQFRDALRREESQERCTPAEIDHSSTARK